MLDSHFKHLETLMKIILVLLNTAANKANEVYFQLYIFRFSH